MTSFIDINKKTIYDIVIRKLGHIMNKKIVYQQMKEEKNGGMNVIEALKIIVMGTIWLIADKL